MGPLLDQQLRRPPLLQRLLHRLAQQLVWPLLPPCERLLRPVRCRLQHERWREGLQLPKSPRLRCKRTQLRIVVEWFPLLQHCRG